MCLESPWSKQNKHREHVPVNKKLLIKGNCPFAPALAPLPCALSFGLSLVLKAAWWEAGADGEAL